MGQVCDFPPCVCKIVSRMLVERAEVIRAYVKLLGLLLTGSIGQRMASCNGLA